MRGLVAVGAFVGVAAITAFGVRAARVGGSLGPMRGCASAIYTTPVDRPPPPALPVRVGPVIFNSMARITSPRGFDLTPTKAAPYYSVKSPLTIFPSGTDWISVSVIGGKAGASIIYDQRSLALVETRGFVAARAPRNVRLQVCRDRKSGQRLITQYNGGFVVQRLGCIQIIVRPEHTRRVFAATVRMGVRRC